MNNNDSVSVVGRHHPSLDHLEAAERKLSRFFGSFGIDAMTSRERFIDPFVARAARFWRAHGGLDFASVALEEAEAEVQDWLSGILESDEADQRATLMAGRAAFLMCGGAKRFQSEFLMPVDVLPDDFVAAMRRHAPKTVPPSDYGDMHHQPYEAWSFRHVMGTAPFDRGMMQGFSDLFRREGRSFSFIGRNTGPTS